MEISTTRPGFTVTRIGDHVRLDVRADGEEVVSIAFEAPTANMIGETLRRAAIGDGEEGTMVRNAAPKLLEACKAVARYYGDKINGLDHLWDAELLVRAAIAEAEGRGEE